MSKKRWEYMTLTHHAEAIRQELNTIGQEGWELVSIVPGQFHFTAFFKRPVAEKVTTVSAKITKRKNKSRSPSR
jgi:hypothetical protein